MCVGGIRDSIKATLKMFAAAKDMPVRGRHQHSARSHGSSTWELRIGIHSGPVIAEIQEILGHLGGRSEHCRQDGK